MLRTISGIVVGIVAALAVVFLVEAIGHHLFPVPVELEAGDRASMTAWMASVPLPAKLIVAAGWFLGPFAGAWLTLRITDRTWSGWIIAAFFAVTGVATVLMLPHPVWMQFASVACPFAAGWLALRLHRTPYPGEPLLG